MAKVGPRASRPFFVVAGVIVIDVLPKGHSWEEEEEGRVTSSRPEPGDKWAKRPRLAWCRRGTKGAAFAAAEWRERPALGPLFYFALSVAFLEGDCAFVVLALLSRTIYPLICPLLRDAPAERTRNALDVGHTRETAHWEGLRTSNRGIKVCAFDSSSGVALPQL